MKFGKPPVSVGEVREVKIVAMGKGGDGIAKVNGFVVFVPGTNTNDVVKVKVTKVLKQFAFAEVVE